MSTNSIAGQKFFGGAVAILLSMIQSAVLNHQLADCYPYKVLPSSELYVQAGRFAFFAGPILVILFVVISAKARSFWWYGASCIAAASLICPLAYLLIYWAYTPTIVPNYVSPDFSTHAAWIEFRQFVLITIRNSFMVATTFFALLSVTQIGHAPKRA